MMMSTIKVNIFGGKEIELLFLIIFSTYLCTRLLKFTQMHNLIMVPMSAHT